MADITEDVLKLLKGGALLTAKEIELRLGLPLQADQKPVRNAIDALRARNEPIWKDPRGFWWSNDRTTSPVGTGSRWKRSFDDNRN